MIVEPLPLTRERLGVFANPDYSYLRALEFELIDRLKLDGRVFDFGGGSNTIYVKRLKLGRPVEGMNIDPRTEPTYLHDANTPFPIADATYDTAISFNTFEHVENDILALAEFLRVLKPGGRFHIIVPFLYRVHGSPSDFNRHTAFWWDNALARNGIPSEASRIEPMGWGRLTTAFSFLEYTRLRPLRKLPLWLDLVVPAARDYREDYALGYHISGTKPGA
jgi:SAM-dependent methyltransferase